MMAQQSSAIDIPRLVSQAFSTRYPSVTPTKWQLDKEAYIASFTLDGKHSLAYYAANGDFIKTETVIRHKKDLPAEVRMGLRKSPYSSWFVDKMVETRNDTLRTVTIEVSEFYNYEIGQMEVYRLCFSLEGKLINKEKLPMRG